MNMNQERSKEKVTPSPEGQQPFVRAIDAAMVSVDMTMFHLTAPEVVAFLSHLAVDVEVAGSTQNQALFALVFLYRMVPERPREGLAEIEQVPICVREQ